jgi:2-oxoisovalerate dehydrogenase E1 component
MKLDVERLESLYTTMVKIRRFDEKTTELFVQGLVKGTAHSYVGEEAVAAAACANLRADDYIVGTHRGHGHCIAKGARVDRMMAELFGRVDGYCRGLGGSMHIAALDLNILGCNGIVAAGLPIGNGAALAARLRKTDRVVIAFFGDGASSQGVVHESLNLAAVWKLPIIFLCENNQYALSTSSKRTIAGESIAARAAAYAIPGVRVDGNDALAVYEAVRTAVVRARAGEGPTLVEALTYRWGGHSMRANLPDYRTKDEEREWMERDPIARLRAELERGGASVMRLKDLEESVEVEMDRAVAFATASAEPTVDVMESSVYAPHQPATEPTERGGPERTMAEAINEALHAEMSRDERVFVMGEDVSLIGGIFGVTRGLRDKFGEDRVRDTPISEAGFLGAGVGAAIAGMRPIVEIQIWDFIAVAMDQVVNQAAKFRYMLGGGPTVPLVIRGPQGGGIRLAAQHSQCLEAWFAHVPGLVVVAPSTPYDAKGLLISAIRDDNPVIFLEHKALYAAKGPVPAEPYAIPLGRADVKREGTDVTVVATQAMVARALAAAVDLEKDGISVEVIDPRTLVPLDEATILASVRKTHRLVVAHEAVKRSGFGAELAAIVAEKAIDDLDAPVLRVGARAVPMPYNDVLERATIPTQADIAEAIRSLF